MGIFRSDLSRVLVARPSTRAVPVAARLLGRRCSWNRRQYGVAAANTHAGDFEMAVHVAALRWGAAPVDAADGPEDATSPGVPTPRGFFD